MNRLTDLGRTILQPWVVRQWKLAASRPRLNRDEFISATAERGGDAEAAGVIWSHLETLGLESGFSPYPDDNLGSIYGIAEEELEVDLLTTLLCRLSLPLPTTDTLRQFGRVDTPLDVALLVTHLRRVP